MTKAEIVQLLNKHMAGDVGLLSMTEQGQPVEGDINLEDYQAVTITKVVRVPDWHPPQTETFGRLKVTVKCEVASNG